MAELYRVYAAPVYTFLRRWGHSTQSARDLTQDFFGYLWEFNLVAKADPGRARFRSFLLGVLKKFVAHEQSRQKTLKRGAGCEWVSIDITAAEGFYSNEPATDETPEKIFDRRWALAVLEQAMERLRAEYLTGGFGELFQSIEPYLTGGQDTGFAELGAALGKSEGAARVLVCRLRKRFAQLIRSVIADTVSGVDDVEAELAHLQAALRG
jgi:RNA polymerase sigma-70 factor (ECF subfamily)